MKTQLKDQTKKNAANKSKPEKIPDNCRIKKKYLKSKPVCKVTFILPKDAAPNARSVTIVGDFNSWDRKANPLKSLKSGDYTITLDLEKGEYRYRYLIDGSKWENDWYADKYLPNAFGCDNSVVLV